MFAKVAGIRGLFVRSIVRWRCYKVRCSRCGAVHAIFCLRLLIWRSGLLVALALVFLALCVDGFWHKGGSGIGYELECQMLSGQLHPANQSLRDVPGLKAAPSLVLYASNNLEYTSRRVIRWQVRSQSSKARNFTIAEQSGMAKENTPYRSC